MKPAHPKNHLAAIHIAHKALGWDKDTACACKQAVTGVASAGDMTVQQRKRYLAHLASLQAQFVLARGDVPTYVPKARPELYRSVDDAHDARWLKARALWGALGRAGVVHTDTDDALLNWVKRQTHVAHWRFLNGYQCNTVIESLKQWCVAKGVTTPTQD